MQPKERKLLHQAKLTKRLSDPGKWKQICFSS